MMRVHLVRQGEYLTLLAERFGFDPDAVWNHTENRELREKRSNPNMLAPGDLLYVPAEPESKSLKLTAGGAHRFVATVPTVTIAIVLREGEQPIANEPFVVDGLARDIEGVSDANGRVTFEVPVGTRQVRLILCERNVAHSVWIGDLDPIDEPSGLRQRLAHLAHHAIAVGEAALERAPIRREADADVLRRFQQANGLPDTGIVDDETREAILRVHQG